MLFKTRMEEAREALKKLDFDDELILIHAEPGNQKLSKAVSEQVAGLIRAKAAVECQPRCYFSVPFGEAARAICSATPIPLVMSSAERAELHQRHQRLLGAFTLAGSALTLASKYETSIMKPESLAQTTDAHRWMLCLFDAALWYPKGLPGGHVGRTVEPTCEETWDEFVATAVHGLPARCWYSRLPNCRDVSVGLIDLMLDIDETNRLAKAPPATPSSEGTPVDDVAETIKRVAMMLGEDGGKIMAIVSHPTFTVDQKLRALGDDKRFKGYSSPVLAKMLGVSEGSIRNSDVWREWNPKPAKQEKSAQK